MRLILLHLIFILLTVPAAHTYAAADDEESVYDSLESDLAAKDRSKTEAKPDLKKAVKEFKSISDLAELSPFSDIAVINKKYLPKTGRFELSAQVMVGLNNAFFSNLGAKVNFDYYFNENWGIELSYYNLIDSERDITKNLSSERDIETRSFVLPQSYYGAALKWSPIYGKMALFEKRIVSFDWFFTVGGGLTETVIQEEPTLHLGFGQFLALSKNWAFRWGIDWNLYEATILRKRDGALTTSLEETTTFHNDLFLSIGVSFFFPEVDYR